MKKFFSIAATFMALSMMGGCSLFQTGNDNSNGGDPVFSAKVYMPDGAPALALAKLMHEDTADDGVSYYVVDAKTIAARVNNADMEKNADICVMPITAASKILGTGEKYTMLGLATQGNLFLMSQTTETELTENTLGSLLGKTVVIAQMNEVPGMTFKAILEEKNLPWQELKEGVEASADKVNLAVAAAAFDYELVAEPAVSKRLAMTSVAKPWKVVGDIQKLYGGEDSYGFPQAAIVVKNEFLTKNGDWVREFMADVSLAHNWLVGENADEIYQAVTSHFEDEGKAPVFSAATLSSETLARCGVKFALAIECKDEVHAYLSELLRINQSSVKIPSDAFYWGGSIVVPD